jgi:hypothetical protein
MLHYKKYLDLRVNYTADVLVFKASFIMEHSAVGYTNTSAV